MTADRSGLLVRRAEVAGRAGVDVRVRGETVTELGVGLPARPDEQVIDASGGVLLPGLHDHHLHLLSLAAAAGSVRCGPPEVTDLPGLADALRRAPGRWVRGVGYHERVAGVLDRNLLDRLLPDRPVRIQHRGGALWLLNSPAIDALRLSDEPGVERDEKGRPTGRLWRADALLRDRLASDERPDLAAVGRQLAALGVTGVTDATPNLAPDTLDVLVDAGRSGALPQRVLLLGAPAGQDIAARLAPRMAVGPHKILRADHEPPNWDELRAEVRDAHAGGRAVAVHCVTRESLVLTLAVLAEVGVRPGDRIEHGAMVGADVLPLLAELGPTVVTQPGFVAERGADYRRDVAVAEHADLYRYASLLAAGIRVAPSTDAPFGRPDPWSTIAAAANRRTADGEVLGPAERVPAGRVLDGFLTAPDDPGGSSRRIVSGGPADLCLLAIPLAEALRAPSADLVRLTICAGRPVYQAA
jgi:predicted amidohydrolase YtcJ